MAAGPAPTAEPSAQAEATSPAQAPPAQAPPAETPAVAATEAAPSPSAPAPAEAAQDNSTAQTNPAPASPSPAQAATTAGEETPAAPAATPPSDVVIHAIKTTTVARGDSLWRISRIFYGHGIRYHEIFAANSSQIRNPNLIYPGQVFVIPGAK